MDMHLIEWNTLHPHSVKGERNKVYQKSFNPSHPIGL